MKKLFIIAVSCACTAFAGNPSGTIPVNKASKLMVSSCGMVKVIGERRGDIAYTILPQRGNVAISSKVWDGGLLKVWLKAAGSDAWADLELRVPRSLLVTIETTGGDLIATDLDGDLTAKTIAGHIVLDRLTRNAVVKTGGGEIRVGRIDGELKCNSLGGSIHVGAAGAAYFDTSGGEIFIREANGPVVAKTAGGNIRVERAKSSVEASTTGGTIDIAWAAGPVVASTRAGSIQVGAAKGVKCDSTVGAIRLKGVAGAIQAVTGAGTILAELPANSPLEDSTLKTGMGDIVVLIPSNLAVTVNAAGRRIVSEFPAIRSKSVETAGEINGGGPLLKIEAIGGTVYLRRRM